MGLLGCPGESWPSGLDKLLGGGGVWAGTDRQKLLGGEYCWVPTLHPWKLRHRSKGSVFARGRGAACPPCRAPSTLLIELDIYLLLKRTVWGAELLGPHAEQGGVSG